MLTVANLSPEELSREKTVLYASYRGHEAAELVAGIERLGYVEAARRAPFSRLFYAAAFTRSLAPLHHRCLKTLLAIRAVEHIENGRQATRAQAAYLSHIYHQLSEEDRRWCRRQLSLVCVEGT